MAKIDVHSATEKVKVKKEVITVVEEEVPAILGQIRVYSVQYRNYDSTIHIQHKGDMANRRYGFAFDIPGQANHSDKRYLPSLAGTDAVYWPGSLVINGSAASLVGIGGKVFNVPMNTLPSNV